MTLGEVARDDGFADVGQHPTRHDGGRYDRALMALYEFRCRTCASVFEARRPMGEADQPIECPAGHDDTVRLVSLFAPAGRSAPTVDGCCGGVCGCAR